MLLWTRRITEENAQRIALLERYAVVSDMACHCIVYVRFTLWMHYGCCSIDHWPLLVFVQCDNVKLIHHAPCRNNKIMSSINKVFGTHLSNGLQWRTGPSSNMPVWALDLLLKMDKEGSGFGVNNNIGVLYNISFSWNADKEPEQRE